MALAETMRSVPRHRVPPDPRTPRGAIAAIVWHLIPARGLSYAEVGRLKGMSPATVSRITGAKPTATIAKLCRMSEILDLPMETFPLILAGDLDGVKKLPIEGKTRADILGILDRMDAPRDRRVDDMREA
jgi:transcriptional regulator with XRE-family HTH domain